MSNRMPDVVVSNSGVIVTASPFGSAVPVFIGYTERRTVGPLLAVSSWEEFLASFSPPSDQLSPLYLSVRLYFDNGGGVCYVLPAGLLGTVGGDADVITAELVAALTGSDLTADATVTLLCVPDILRLGSGAEDRWREVWQAMLNVCRARVGCFALLDLPSEADAAVAVLDSPVALDNAEFGAAYWPHLECVYLDDNGQRVVTPPSGALAAHVQRTDRERGVWKAPANEPLLQVIKAQFAPQAGQQVLNHTTSVNLIRSFPGRGVRVWGCRTLLPSSSASPWRFVQVRRLLGYVEAQLSALARFCVFERNHEITWLKLKSLCRSWLRTLWLDGALYGESEEEAFRLYVGLGESMTEDDLQAGRLILRLELSALYPAEYIELSLRFVMMETQMSRNLT